MAVAIPPPIPHCVITTAIAYGTKLNFSTTKQCSTQEIIILSNRKQ